MSQPAQHQTTSRLLTGSRFPMTLTSWATSISNLSSTQRGTPRLKKKSLRSSCNYKERRTKKSFRCSNKERKRLLVLRSTKPPIQIPDLKASRQEYNLCQKSAQPKRQDLQNSKPLCLRKSSRKLNLKSQLSSLKTKDSRR